MTRNSMKATALAATVLLGGVVGANCSKGSKGDDTTGNISLALTLPGGVSINSVDYRIHAGAAQAPAVGPIADVTGTINTSDPNATASVAHSFPASTGDTVTLMATTAGGVSCTGTSMPFSLMAGGEAHVSVTVLCGTGGTTNPTQPDGTVYVDGTFTVVSGNVCPLLTSWVASPLQTSVGATISVGGTATDSDAGETLTYSWADGATVFATTATANYTCGAAGAHTLTFSVSDSHSPPCSTSTSIVVNCVAVSGGGGSTGAAGAAGGSTGAAGAAAGSTGAAGAAAGSTGAAGAAAGSTGAAGAAAGAGGSAAGSTGAAGMGAAGSNGGQTTACIQCEITNTQGGVCFNTSSTANSGTTNPALFGCNGFAGADRTNCNALIACLNGSACQNTIATAVSTNAADYPFSDDPTPCLCGTSISKAACLQASSWSGPCASLYVAAAAGGSVLNLFGSTDSPIGVANNLMSCEIDSLPASGFGIGVPCGAGLCL
jgi:hypothetical protein